MGKFNLLTIMTLNAAGYTAGIDDAKKSTASLVNGTNTAVNSISSQFSKLGGMGASVIAPLGGIKGAVTAGITSFRTMIPAINGIKVALVSTGIGAIVVALGLAFVALNSYMSGTSEGSKKLREMLGYVSGTVTALMNRVKHLGGALFSLLTGDITGFKKGIAEAFASGFFDEVVASAKESNDIEKQKSANVLIQRNLKTQIADLELQSAKLNQKARDPKLSDEARLKYLYQILDTEDKIESTKLNAAKAELKYRQDIVKMKGFSANGEDKDAVADALVNVRTIEKARVEAGTKTQRLESKLLNGIAKEEEDIHKKRVKDALELLNLKYKVGGKDIGVNNISIDTPELDLKGIDKSIYNTEKRLQEAKKGIKGFAIDVAETVKALNQNVISGINKLGGSIATSFANMITGEEGAGFGELFKGILSVVGEFITQMGAAVMAYAFTMEAFKKAFTNPLVAIGAGLALMIAGGVVFQFS